MSSNPHIYMDYGVRDH